MFNCFVVICIISLQNHWYYVHKSSIQRTRQGSFQQVLKANLFNFYCWEVRCKKQMSYSLLDANQSMTFKIPLLSVQRRPVVFIETYNLRLDTLSNYPVYTGNWSYNVHLYDVHIFYEILFLQVMRRSCM